jgi:DNA invertase Pin-like site-specific DNA recombinase
VLGAVAEFEKNVLVLKLRAARERKRKRGERVEGAKPYGHFPAERAVVDRMRQLRRKPAKGRRLSLTLTANALTPKAIAIAPAANGPLSWSTTY